MRKAMYLVGSLALLSSASWATDYARVISSTALVEQVPVTRQSCVTENVMVPPQPGSLLEEMLEYLQIPSSTTPGVPSGTGYSS